MSKRADAGKTDKEWESFWEYLDSLEPAPDEEVSPDLRAKRKQDAWARRFPSPVPTYGTVPDSQWHDALSKVSAEARLVEVSMKNPKLLRQSSLLEYRCVRGCYLGGLVEIGSSGFWLSRADLRLKEIDSSEILEILENHFPSETKGLREHADYYLAPDSPGYEPGLPAPNYVPTSVAEALSLSQNEVITQHRGLQLRAKHAAFLSGAGENSYLLVCPHHDVDVSFWRVETDLRMVEQRQNKRKKTIYIGPDA